MQAILGDGLRYSALSGIWGRCPSASRIPRCWRNCAAQLLCGFVARAVLFSKLNDEHVYDGCIRDPIMPGSRMHKACAIRQRAHYAFWGDNSTVSSMT